MSGRHGKGMLVFGPVPSRRLGLSLGVDVVPFKTCTLDCCYCQVGRTTRKTARRASFVDPDEVVSEVRRVLESARDVDRVTFAGSGEPTLNADLGRMIRGIKRFAKVPVAVLTNGTLLWDGGVASDLSAADEVLPSLDAASPEVFERLNRPCRGLSLAKVLAGLVRFRKRYRGRFYLEVMLIRGVNDSPGHLALLRDRIRELRPDRVDINSPVRPSDEKPRSLTDASLRRIRSFFGRRARLLAHGRKAARQGREVGAAQVGALAFRRPVTMDDIRRSFGLRRAEAVRLVRELLGKGELEPAPRSGRIYYRRPQRRRLSPARPRRGRTSASR